MNTAMTLCAPNAGDAGEQRLAERIAARFAEAERRFSRFDPESELSRLNHAAGPVQVSEELFAMLALARRLVHLTDGLFDPAVGGALEALGYDRSFAPGALDTEAPPRATPRRASFLEVELEPETRTVTRPTDLVIDLGGLVKGFTVDASASLLPSPAALDAGGDARLVGAGPEGGGWLVEVEDPREPERLVATLRMTDRAVATSGVNRRRWRRAGELAHHLIDPRTQQPAASDLAQVTVVGPSAALAEVLAKTVLLLGAHAGRGSIARFPRMGALLVGHDGALEAVGDLEIEHA